MSGTEVFSAADSLVGYIYQCEYALFRALDVDDPADYIMVETFDDVVAEGKDSPLELLQLKHHDTSKKKLFTDKSVDLWKTIRIWSSLIKDKTIDPSKTSFYLLTTAQASPSAMLVRYLAPKGAREETRDIEAAETLLLQIARQIEDGTAIDAKKNVEAFMSLPNATRLLLISNITIVPGAPVIADLRKKIVKRLRLTGATSGNMERLAQSLAGWWYWVLVERLKLKDKRGIDKNLLQEKITDLVSQYVLSSLPIFDEITNPDLSEEMILLQRLFISQLVYIGHAIEKTTIAGALRDFYKSDGHIKRWFEELRLQPKELQDFKDQLYGHWEVKFGSIEPDAVALRGCSNEEIELAKLGRYALQEVLAGSQAKLKDIELDYLRRGVLHIMADEPTIGWHPHWSIKFKAMK